MAELLLTHLPMRVRKYKEQAQIWDMVRRKYVALLPEELVRQQLVHYLVKESQVPLSLIRVEYALHYAQLNKRADILVFDSKGKLYVLVECKAPQVALSQAVVEQVCHYNTVLRASYVLIYNGLEFRCFAMHYATGQMEEVAELPFFA